ncbi:MAG: tRNA pseudouridine(55) synthase TruB [bacterium]|nr:tRNA pseudouridine(55) synthase TruB [bacterium]
MDGIVLIDKPKGWTSFDVVAKVRGQLKRETGLKKPKVGHTGTLDPLATGLLVLVCGTYTKRAQEFSKLDKVYEAELTLGFNSTTDDNEGDKTKISDKIPSLNEVQAVLNTFVGEQKQLPPAFSAIKVDGQRAYKLARAGKQVVIEPRTISIYQISDIKYSYPTVNFTVAVSSGTYIRSLARDIGEKLGTGAFLSQLRRTSVGQYDVKNSFTISAIGDELVVTPVPSPVE